MRFEAGTNLYRAGNLKSPAFFTLKPENAQEYGSVGHYKLTRPVDLMNVTDPVVIRRLLNTKNAPVNAISQAFRINGPNVRRNSNKNRNSAVAKFIGSLGFNGYYGKLVRTIYPEGYFHAEVALRDPNAVKAIGMTNFLVPPPIKKRPRIRLGN